MNQPASYFIVSMKLPGDHKEALSVREDLRKLGAYDISIRTFGGDQGGYLHSYTPDPNAFCSKLKPEDIDAQKRLADSVFKTKAVTAGEKLETGDVVVKVHPIRSKSELAGLVEDAAATTGREFLKISSNALTTGHEVADAVLDKLEQNFGKELSYVEKAELRAVCITVISKAA